MGQGVCGVVCAHDEEGASARTVGGRLDQVAVGGLQPRERKHQMQVRAPERFPAVKGHKMGSRLTGQFEEQLLDEGAGQGHKFAASQRQAIQSRGTVPHHDEGPQGLQRPQVLEPGPVVAGQVGWPPAMA